ncbi:efflux RND transporter periplasmic adaptor subunit [Ningiella sp. W23]|uniref:efflux RND transporter periplasmic adaptor subunit n=1 Tax=Ningiella sp. W23 TaxID=3023715 RepID=UPI00375652B4
MDIARSTKKRPNKKLISIMAITVIIVCLLTLGFLSLSNAGNSVSAQELVLATVEQEEFVVSVRGMGVLAPKEERWISTSVNASIEQLFVKPGTVVAKGDAIAQLSNPELVQSMDERQWELDELIATNNALSASLNNELLNLKAAVLEAKLNYERSLLTLDAQKKLMSQGVNAVSQIDFESSKIEAEQNKQRWELAQNRLASQKQNNQAQLIASQARFKRLQHIANRAKVLVEGLTMKASQDAVVKELSVELGQQVVAGTNIVKIASRDQFIAELRIPENLINQVAMGQAVSLDSRTSLFAGEVSRIDPAVINGLVQVDVEIVSEMPDEARPELTIEGVIEIAKKPNALFVKRPMYARGLSESNVFVLDADGKSATKTLVEFGQSSSTHIEIIRGIEPGQKIIISDANKWASKPQIAIN